MMSHCKWKLRRLLLFYYCPDYSGVWRRQDLSAEGRLVLTCWPNLTCVHCHPLTQSLRRVISSSSVVSRCSIITVALTASHDHGRRSEGHRIQTAAEISISLSLQLLLNRLVQFLVLNTFYYHYMLSINLTYNVPAWPTGGRTRWLWILPSG